MTQHSSGHEAGGPDQTRAGTEDAVDAQRDRQDGAAEDLDATEQPPDPDAGIDREVGDPEDPDAEQDGALPGRVGGGLAGG